MSIRIFIADREILVDIENEQDLLALRKDLQEAIHYVEECIDEYSIPTSTF